MNSNTTAERVVDIKDSLYFVCRSWRKVVISALIIAILVGAYQVFSGLRVEFSTERKEKAQEQYEISLESWKATGERLRISISNLREQLAHQEEYNEKSVLMKINPTDKWSGSFQMYIDSKYQIDPSLSFQNIDLTNRLISAYVSYLCSGDLYQDIIDHIPAIDEMRFLSEVYRVSADPGTATITINCVGISESDILEMISFVKTKIAEHYEAVYSAIGDHNYDFLTESVYSSIDLGLDEIQKNNILVVSEYANRISKANEELTRWEKENEPQPQYGTRYIVKKTIKMCVIGFVIGVLLVCVWFMVKYILSDSVKTDSDLAIYKAPVLGHIVLDRKKKLLPQLDSLIDRMFGHTVPVSAEQSCALAAYSLGAILKERKTTQASVVGRLSDGTAETLTQKMNAANAGVSFRYTGDILTDPAAVQNLDGNAEVLLLAERYRTKCTDVEKTITLLDALGKTVMGAVVVD